MEMTYGGALVMPSNYAAMSEEEMTYVEGGGTPKVVASANTVKKLLKGGFIVFNTILCSAMGLGAIAVVISDIVANFVWEVLEDICQIKYVSINKSWTNGWLPNGTINLSKLFD